MAQQVYLQQPLSGSLETIISALNVDNILLVTGKSSFEKSGAAKQCEKLFSKISVTTFNDFSPNPTLEEVRAAIAAFHQSNADVILAIGGGSALDIAKSVNALALLPDEQLEAYVTGTEKIVGVAKPLIAVPTTAGSGSEATHFAVVYIDKKKYSLAHQMMLPNYAIIDPSLTYSLPQSIAAASGLDALAQAIESYWSINATDESQADAREALELIVPNLVAAATEQDEAAKDALARGAYLAGKAINVSKTTAAHALSYALTSNFGVQHGHAVVLILPEVLIHNAGVSEADVSDERGVVQVQNALEAVYGLLEVRDAQAAAAKLRTYTAQVGLETNLSAIGVKSEDIPHLLEGVSAERMGNNPRALSAEMAHGLFTRIM